MDIGFIGLGGMGKAIATNLLRGGHGVTVWNRSPDVANALASEGAKVASSAPKRLLPVSSSRCWRTTRRTERHS